MLDGLAKPEDYLKICEEYDMPACAVTDHGGTYGLIDFYEKAKKKGIKPILGVEFYMARRTRHDKQAGMDNKPYHLVLLAKNFQGYLNLLQLTTKANLEGYYYKPRIDWEILEEYGEGLIGLSACMQGQIANSLLSGREQEAEATLQRFQKILGKDNFYLEIQHHPELPDQAIANEKIITLARKTDTPLVATNDCHYAKKTDAEAHDTLICIQTNAYVQDENRMRYDGNYSMLSPAEMWEAFGKIAPDALENTVKIAEQCNVEIDLGGILLPKFAIPENFDSEKNYLRHLAEKGFEFRYGFEINKKSPNEDEKTKIDRLNYELDMVDEMGFNAYFLIVQDFVMYAKNNGILVGPGRGSAAGSILSYCLQITDLDPLRYGLIFERFLNPARVSMPDIDIDFADDRRGEVMQYVRDKYGHTNVSQIITFGTMAAKAAVKDVARVFAIPFNDANKLTDAIPSKPGTKLQEALDTEADLQEYYKDPKYKKVIDIALKLEGTIRQVGVHACAVVISELPLTNYTALQNPPGNKGDDIISQYSAKPIEALGLLKMDFLGLKNLTLMDKTIKIVERTRKEKITLSQIPENDEKAFELLRNGDTTGVFQLESAGMKRYLKQLKPENLEDIIAMVSLYRPGPMEWIPDYIAGKHGTKEVKYLHADLEEILKLTYGVAVYQEQTMQIAQKFAGFTMADADILRKAIGKKIASLLNEQKEKFITGAEKLGHDKKLAKEIFEKVIEPFAGYGFNKSHAACYAQIAYLTAYLKSHYPAEFMAALMTADQNDSDRIAIEFEECERMGIKVLPPDINESFRNFTVTDDGNIRFGLLAIKGVGDAVVAEITAERDANGAFENLENFLQRLSGKALNKKSLEAFSLAGALDKLGERAQLFGNLEMLLNYAQDHRKSQDTNQQDIFGLMSEADANESQNLILENIRPAGTDQKLAWEKEYLGMYVSGHPLDGLEKYLARKYLPIKNITQKHEGKDIEVAGLVTNLRKIMTKTGKPMLSAKLTDNTGEISLMLFTRNYEMFAHEFTEDAFVKVKGRISFRRDELQLMVSEAKKVRLEIIRENAQRAGNFVENLDKLTLKIPQGTKKSQLEELNELFKKNAGPTPVSIELWSENRWQTVELPLSVKLTPELHEKIDEIL